MPQKLASWVALGQLLLVSAGTHAFAEKSMFAYIGTYTGEKSKGIYLAHFNPEEGELSPPELVAETKNPTFLALHPSKQILYAVGETDDFEGKKSGAVLSYAIDKKTGKLTFLNQQASGGTGPCHVSVDSTGRSVLVANYGSGSVAIFPVAADGRLEESRMVVQHRGSSVNPQRQAGPHAHCVLPDPDNHFALVADLGLDKVVVYELNAAQSLLSPRQAGVITPGAGPRHIAFHPTNHVVFVVTEMGSTLTSMDYNPETGSLKELQTVSTLPPEFKGHNSGAEVQVHPNGHFVYASNRGHNSIAIFRWYGPVRKLSLIGTEPTLGKNPRHFTLDPTGRWLIAENQNSDSVVVFEVDSNTGLLKPTGNRIEVGSPVCLVWRKK
jgi:6-phosphogluconolactonase